MIDRSHILTPYLPHEAIGTAEAAKRAGIAQRTMREWVGLYPIGRKIGRRVKVSKAALQMLLDGDDAALEAYASGDRTSELVVRYFDAL